MRDERKIGWKRGERGWQEKKEAAVKWLTARGLLAHVDMAEAIRQKGADLLYVEDDGVMIYEADSQTCMISTENEEACREILRGRTFHQFAVHQEGLAAELQAQYHFSHSMATYQAAWMEEEGPAAEEEGIEKLRPCHVDEICSHYGTMDDPREYVEELLRRGQMWGIFDQKTLTGFMGEHLEGSMGLLEILPQYRRQGRGFRLEASVIRHFLAEGRIPFCQVIEGNDMSMKLQQKLGMSISREATYWLFD